MIFTSSAKATFRHWLRSNPSSSTAMSFFFILGKYYRGGEYDYLLNKEMDTDVFFHCPFIVFELDNIKDHATIFPVATLIIIDIFMQKMRRLKGGSKGYLHRRSMEGHCYSPDGSLYQILLQGLFGNTLARRWSLPRKWTM